MIGYDESEVLCVKSVEYYVEVVKREKRACKQCEEQYVAMAPLPPRIIDKNLWSRIRSLAGRNMGTSLVHLSKNERQEN